MKEHLRNPSDTRTGGARPLSVLAIGGIVLLLLLMSCGRKLEGTAPIDNGNNSSGRGPSTAIDAGPIVQKYRALDDSHDSTIKMRASVGSHEQSVELNAPRQVHFTMYRKHQPDGRVFMLVEFTAPAEERDRDGLITVFPDGQIEGVRYVQSTDSFIVTRDVLSEDALFGLTLQELADGQPEKYDFTVLDEEMLEGTPGYRLEGKLKHNFESKFPRVVLLISKQNFAAARAEFYDNHDEMARNLAVTKTDSIAGHLTRMRWTIENRARQKKIEFETLDANYDTGLKDSMFTREHLKKLASR